MTYRECAQIVLSSVGDPACKRFYPGELEQWINEAIRYVRFKLAAIDLEAVVGIWQRNLNKGQANYTMPDDVWRVISVMVNGNIAKPATSVEEYERIKAGKLAHHGSTQSTPVWIEFQKRQIRIWPAPNEDIIGGLFVRLIYSPTAMTDQTHDFPLPTIYAPAVQRYVEEKYRQAAGLARPVSPEQAVDRWLGLEVPE